MLLLSVETSSQWRPLHLCPHWKAQQSAYMSGYRAGADLTFIKSIALFVAGA
jgi:hypothetical protein